MPDMTMAIGVTFIEFPKHLMMMVMTMTTMIMIIMAMMMITKRRR